jgi:hypothetical protein
MNVDKLKYFVMFAGYPRSGHTLVASILNAHPNVVISNQLFILKDIEKFTKQSLFDHIKLGAREGIWKSEVKIKPVTKSEISVVGDKTGHRTMEFLGGYKTLLPFFKEMKVDPPKELSKLKEIVGVPVKWIHVVRNPYDNLATWVKKNHESRERQNKTSDMVNEFNEVFEKYRHLNEKIAELKQTENVLSINHERVIRFIDRSLDSLCEFLDIEKYPEWRKRVINSLWKEPRETRSNIKWDQNKIAKVEELVQKYEWLNGYDIGRRRG